ncbi:MAG TPA: preQ(1) synthase [Candidatus Omnitrophota bacterium]|nr:preQ(1) synthase [Candidatus Omnitrophota bacterium]HPN55322.1 preQ(1) synthase [Candidatus Omnitrophota bacterium]
MKRKSAYEGLQAGVRTIPLPDIDVWENQYADRTYLVDLEIPEFTCICPKTGLPDFASVRVSYEPRQWCLELKSFKMYIVAYRNLGIFHEHLVNRILDDIVKACHPRRAKVAAVMNPRGGITTTVTAEYQGRATRGAGKK